MIFFHIMINCGRVLVEFSCLPEIGVGESYMRRVYVPIGSLSLPSSPNMDL